MVHPISSTLLGNISYHVKNINLHDWEEQD